MAQAMASMTGLEGSFLQISGSSRLITSTSARVSLLAKPGFTVRSQSSEAETSRRAVLGLVAGGLATGSFVQAVFAGAKSIQIGGPPPPSGGLPGTLNADEARDFELPLNKRFFLQPLAPTEAAARAKESAKDILNVKPLIEKKAWPYVQNDLRNKAGYLRFDLNTVISAKPKDEKIALKELYTKLFKTISQLDYAAKTKDSPSAEKYYGETVSALNDVLAKLG